ncbi:MAG TPA: Gmad2 immunoglobulin-like domain-containing protein [Anaerolineales bacterium]
MIAALACNVPGGGSSPTNEIPPSQLTQTASAATPAPVLPTATQASPTISPLTANMLKNGTYKLPQLGQTVTLVNGKFDRDTPDSDIVHAALLNPLAFGDLNGDGAEDAAVLLSESSGGTGDWISVVVVLNQGGAPVQSADRLIDDRAQINGMTIQTGRIAVDAVIHGVGDPLCCPNFPVKETLQLRNNQLILTHFTSTPSGGSLREILLTAPAQGAAVSGSMQVVGSVTVSPFENTLAYSIFDMGGNLLGSGPILVASAGMGTPGTFNSPIDVSAIPAGAVIRLEVSDLSAADGSILAMDSVECKVH